ncbi:MULTISPECIES: LysR substrate-binding domain-containing protein [Klebsiella]|uniref:LysR substrate-binding domain-containing protein n=1 Tax=Klebsiella TaxID=570 RepID=UPI000B4164D5|nr:LysR substrate-binding domain-containing protein [Klebsiella quasipneumoniae]HBT6083348.1 LysR family transcriptional regulator [Klebsiella quasipneumoniae]HBT6124635.1 LysR family transcriptional regulator [Klebsiella quasipneumoniae]HBT6223647.1 LysR family transcriptional regulator [Klebsiella quasipneumoniae]HBT6242214.1 LysR family transcriptional regulator [Klebsiella quasipneumoniae]HDG7904973.1 LysR family transcriptional regulator [Klebsiella quasipneumoniae]
MRMIMEKRLPGLDLDALRSFVTGMECGSFALAAQRLARSTSAVSAQLKKLESQCGVALVVKQGRHLALTAEGEKLMSYARRLLALNDETLRALQGERLTGEIHLGMQEDFGESLMPGILGQFTRHHPQVRIVARVDRNGPLRQALAEQTLDLALLWQTEDQGPGLGRCPLAWIAHPDFDVRARLASGEPLPLVMFDSPCLMRSRAIACLDAAGIPWQVVFVSHSLSGIWAAVQAGLGLTVRSRIGMPGNLRPAGGSLPSPGNLAVSLQQTPRQEPHSAAVTLLGELMYEALQEWVAR